MTIQDLQARIKWKLAWLCARTGGVGNRDTPGETSMRFYAENKRLIKLADWCYGVRHNHFINTNGLPDGAIEWYDRFAEKVREQL